MKKKSKPTINASNRQKRRNVTLSDRHAIIASRISGGSVSKGIRIAIEAYYDSIED